MKSEEYWEQYKDFSGEFSKAARTLAFGSLAISWLFKSEEFLFPTLIVAAIITTTLFFVLDTLQYFVSSVIYKRFIRRQEIEQHRKDGTIDFDVGKPECLDWPAESMWWGKSICLLATYVFIGIYLVSRFN